MCRTFPDAADLFSGVNALCRYGIYRQSSTSENAVFVEIQQRCIVNSEVRLLSPAAGNPLLAKGEIEGKPRDVRKRPEVVKQQH